MNAATRPPRRILSREELLALANSDRMSDVATDHAFSRLRFQAKRRQQGGAPPHFCRGLNFVAKGVFGDKIRRRVESSWNWAMAGRKSSPSRRLHSDPAATNGRGALADMGASHGWFPRGNRGSWGMYTPVHCSDLGGHFQDLNSTQRAWPSWPAPENARMWNRR